LVLPFWYLLTRVDPDIFQTSSKMVVCVCEFLHENMQIPCVSRSAAGVEKAYDNLLL